VASGRGRHAYWLLEQRVDVDTGEDANLRLAHHLAADQRCFDAARILRPPHTTNYQHHPARPVRLLCLAADQRHTLASVTADLPRPPADHAPRSRQHDGAAGRTSDGDPLLELDPATYVSALLGVAVGRDRKVSCPFHTLSGSRAINDEVSPARSLADASASECRGESRTGAGSRGAPWLIASSDPLRLVPPPVYFERLTGLRVGRSGKLHCLFHDDRSPSLHVYPEPDRGWYCFGCGRGGSIFDLAALLLGRGTRGRDFAELRRELEELML
jgi:hypothetical protein